jgi:hypothetical protein
MKGFIVKSDTSEFVEREAIGPLSDPESVGRRLGDLFLSI